LQPAQANDGLWEGNEFEKEPMIFNTLVYCIY